MGYRKGLRTKEALNEETCRERFTLEKDEKKLFLAMAEAWGLRGANGKPSLSKAMVYLSRQALQCYAHHGAPYQNPQDIPKIALRDAGLNVVSGKTLRKPEQIKTITRRADGRTMVEYDED